MRRLNDWVLKFIFQPLKSIQAKPLKFSLFYFFSLGASPHRFALAPHVFVDPLRVARLEIQFW